MASYNELLRQYRALKGQPRRRRQFLEDHPNFAERLRRDDGDDGDDTVTGSVSGTASLGDKPPAPSGGAPGNPMAGMQTAQQAAQGAPIPPPGGEYPTWPDYLSSSPGGSTPPPTTGPAKDPDDPCPPGYHLDKELGACVLDVTDKEDDPCPPGWHLDTATNRCVKDEERTEADKNNDLMARINDLLSQFGLNTPGLLDFAKQAISKGWGINEFMLELRKHPDYLANPLFAANIERTRNGKRFMSEAEVLNWAGEAKRLAKQFGYNEPSDNYLAAGLLSGLSMAEIEQRFQIQDRINLYGAGVKFAAQEMGFEIGDSNLFEIFDPEKDTKEWEDMFRRAQMRGRPLTLGLGIRSEAEARAWEMMGLTPDEVFKRMEDVAGNRSRFERLGTIEESIRKGLPDNFGSHLMTAENGLLIRALVFQRPDALAELQDMTAREIARFKTGGSPVSSQGQQVGLLSGAERQTYS